MVAVLERRREPVLQEIIERYPEVSPFVIIKIDVQRRGVRYTDRALAQADPSKHLMQARNMFASVGENNDLFPVSLLLRDGTTIISAMSPDPERSLCRRFHRRQAGHHRRWHHCGGSGILAQAGFS